MKRSDATKTLDNAAVVLKLRDGTASHRSSNTASTNTVLQRAKNRKLIDEALREAEVLRCKNAQLGRVWKHNAELLRNERKERQHVDRALREQHKECDEQVKDVHALLATISTEAVTLAREGTHLQKTVEQYSELCRRELKEADIMQDRIQRMQDEKERIVRSASFLLSEMKVKVEAIEGFMSAVDAEIDAELQENLRLRLEVGLGGS